MTILIFFAVVFSFGGQGRAAWGGQLLGDGGGVSGDVGAARSSGVAEGTVCGVVRAAVEAFMGGTA